MDYSYATERYDTEVNAREYIEGFHNADYFIKFCQQCRNYGCRYGCPPFDYDPLEVIKRYDRVRPSLEAFGFDISKTAKELLGLEIKWSSGDFIPEYLTLVGGIFY